MLLTDAHPRMERDLRFFPAENRNPKTLTRAEVDQFNRKGFVFPLDVFDESGAETNRAWFDDLMQRAAAAGHNSYSINGWDKYCSRIYDLAVEPRIVDFVEDLLGPDLICTMTHFFCKEPGETKQVAWHQDASYWAITPEQDRDRVAGDRRRRHGQRADDGDSRFSPARPDPVREAGGHVCQRAQPVGAEPARLGGRAGAVRDEGGPGFAPQRPAAARLGAEQLGPQALRPDPALQPPRTCASRRTSTPSA